MAVKRIDTPTGPIYVWTPKGASAQRGTVIYVHGLENTVDQAMVNHRLIEQFERSGVDATFIVPEAPAVRSQAVQFPDLAALLHLVNQHTPLGTGPIIVLGHSFAHVTLRKWLKHPGIRHIVLLDALYSGRSEFKSWAEGDPSRRLTVIGRETDADSRKLVASLGGRYLPSIPSKIPKTRVIGATSQWEHDAIAGGGAVIPIVLRHTDLARVGRSKWVWIAGLLAIGTVVGGGVYVLRRRARNRPRRRQRRLR